MKALIVNKPGTIEIVDIPQTVLSSSNEILVRIVAAGICGSDVAILKGTNPVAVYPRIIGHEMTGVVEEVGLDVTLFRVGDHVIIKQTESCGHCYACLHGRANVCTGLQVRGVTIDGGYREYIAVPEESAYVLGADLDLQIAVLIEPYTIGFHACQRGRLVSDDTLLVYGAGALGAIVIDVASSFGCKILSVDISQEKLDQAKKLGADVVFDGKDPNLRNLILQATGGYGPTICIDCVCTPNSVEFLLDIVGNAGRVVTMGFDARPSSLAQFIITSKEIDLIGSRLQHENFPSVIRLFEEGKIDPRRMVSHVFHFTDIARAVEVVKSGQYSKILLDFT
ncbi:MAG: zinc-binding alcohol dehydrogenase family protein [Sphaerochaeta sp.]|nr:zinc-binding alcohol dehydrogenase family protein [Sphaerochaeta sp.]